MHILEQTELLASEVACTAVTVVRVMTASFVPRVIVAAGRRRVVTRCRRSMIRRCGVVMHIGLRHVTVSVEAGVTMVVATPVGHEHARTVIVETSPVVAGINFE